jgi:hypothetical protein
MSECTALELLSWLREEPENRQARIQVEPLTAKPELSGFDAKKVRMQPQKHAPQDE